MAICNLQTNMTLKETVMQSTSYIGSLNYMKKIIPIAVSTIMARRVEYDENCFNSFKLEEVPYDVFSSRIQKNHPLATIYHAIHEAAELLEKKMIERIVLAINDESNNLLEMYQFQITILNEEENSRFDKSFLPTILQATAKFIRNINLLSDLKKLPSTAKVSIEARLKTITGFELNELSFFKKGRIEEAMKVSCDIKIATVKTNHHGLKVLVNRSVFDNDSFEEATQQNDQAKEVQLEQTDEMPNLNDSLAVSKNSLELVEERIENENEEDSIYDGQISCLCKVLHPVGKVEMVLCPACDLYQHVACLGYKKAGSVYQPYICYDCSKATKQKYKDVRMVRFKFDDQRRALALIRLLSFACVTFNMSPEDIIKKISPVYIKKSVEDLQRFGIISKIQNTFVANLIVMEEQLKGRYFYKESDSQTLDCILSIESSNEKI